MRSQEFLEQLQLDLVAAEQRMAAAPRRTRRVRRWVSSVAAAVAAIVAAAVVWTVGGGTPVGAGLEVIRQGDELHIRLTDVETRPEEIEEAAREAGLDVRVEELPVGPSNVGRFLRTTQGAMVPNLTVDESDPTSAFTGFRVPVDFAESIVLYLGRPAADGETWVSASDATSKGEPLECEDLYLRPLGEVVELIDERGIGSTIRLADTGRTLRRADLAEHVDAKVLVVTNSSGDGVQINAADDLASLPPQQPPPRHGCE